MQTLTVANHERSGLIESLMSQPLIGGNRALADEMMDLLTFQDVESGDIVIEQGGIDKDVYLLFSGEADIVHGGRIIGRCSAGDHVGEMASLGTNQYRTAHVIVTQSGKVGKLGGDQLERLANTYPEIYRCIAGKLARLLAEGNR
jgi:CRP-like cAMP-binding protein